jgi:hypothetical protein
MVVGFWGMRRRSGPTLHAAGIPKRRDEQKTAVPGILAPYDGSSAASYLIDISRSRRFARKDHELDAKVKLSIGEYLEEVARFCDNQYGSRVRNRFEDVRGTSELAMLVVPTSEELRQLRRAVAIMTPGEKQDADRLSDEQVERIAADAHVDPANFAIFMNGYALTCKRVS